jgi:hypothetical protein
MKKWTSGPNAYTRSKEPRRLMSTKTFGDPSINAIEQERDSDECDEVCAECGYMSHSVNSTCKSIVRVGDLSFEGVVSTQRAYGEIKARISERLSYGGPSFDYLKGTYPLWNPCGRLYSANVMSPRSVTRGVAVHDVLEKMLVETGKAKTAAECVAIRSEWIKKYPEVREYFERLHGKPLGPGYEVPKEAPIRFVGVGAGGGSGFNAFAVAGPTSPYTTINTPETIWGPAGEKIVLKDQAKNWFVGFGNALMSYVDWHDAEPEYVERIRKELAELTRSERHRHYGWEES